MQESEQSSGFFLRTDTSAKKFTLVRENISVGIYVLVFMQIKFGVKARRELSNSSENRHKTSMVHFLF